MVLRPRTDKTAPGRGTADGFTLIELMVTVAIVGIIAAVAYPSYTDYVVKGNRAAAQAYMLALANKQEQFMLDSRQYSGTPATLLAVPADVSQHYTVTITTGTAPPTYTITATALQADRDPKCGNLTLTHEGTKGISSSTGTVSHCW
jgi:type IV pilus assembly protein PilE